MIVTEFVLVHLVRHVSIFNTYSGDAERLLADASVFMSCTMVLAVFDISKYSENGVVFEPDTDHTAGVVRYEIYVRSQSINSECALSSLFCSHPTMPIDQ